MQLPVSQPLTWTSVLNVANTALIALVGFLIKEAWTQIHKRIGNVEEQQNDMRERIASLETGISIPRRRRGDGLSHRRGG